MASIKKITGANGKVSYKITVTQGRDLNGKQIRHYKTWSPEEPMTERQMQKAVEKVAFKFEQDIEQGFLVDNKQTFSAYAEYVLELKKQQGVKYRTLERYRELLARINPAIGHLKLINIRPQHLNEFYKNLGEEGIPLISDKATAKIDIVDLMKTNKLSRETVSKLSGVSCSTITAICKGKKVKRESAEKIANVLGEETLDLFIIEFSNRKLSPKTIIEHHRLIRTVLAQAEKEMLVPFNAASKATPPKDSKREVNYFQAADVIRIREALEKEPLRWQVITHLLLITGCRRGEIMGLRWSRVDFSKHQIKIDTNLLYSPKRGIYEDTTKTASSVRNIKLPAETMELLYEYRLWYTNLRFKNGDRWKDSGFLFVKDDGSPMIPDSITAWLRKFSERHDLPHINPHAFRHTMASLLINAGSDIVSVSKRLGHAKASTTMDIYAHVIEQADEQAAESLANIMLRPSHQRIG